jgi:hypothetical protein
MASPSVADRIGLDLGRSGGGHGAGRQAAPHLHPYGVGPTPLALQVPQEAPPLAFRRRAVEPRLPALQILTVRGLLAGLRCG